MEDGPEGVRSLLEGPLLTLYEEAGGAPVAAAGGPFLDGAQVLVPLEDGVQDLAGAVQGREFQAAGEVAQAVRVRAPPDQVLAHGDGPMVGPLPAVRRAGGAGRAPLRGAGRRRDDHRHFTPFLLSGSRRIVGYSARQRSLIGRNPSDL